MPDPPPVTIAILSIRSWSLVASGALQCLDLRQRRLHGVERVERGRPAAIQERVQAKLLQFGARHTVAHGAAQMDLDLVRAIERNALRERDETALAQRQSRPVPYFAPCAFGRPLLERRGEVVRIVELLRYVIRTEHLPAHLETILERLAPLFLSHLFLPEIESRRRCNRRGARSASYAA